MSAHGIQTLASHLTRKHPKPIKGILPAQKKLLEKKSRPRLNYRGVYVNYVRCTMVYLLLFHYDY